MVSLEVVTALFQGQTWISPHWARENPGLVPTSDSAQQIARQMSKFSFSWSC